MTRRSLGSWPSIIIALFLWAGAGFCAQPPNVVLIIADDMSAEDCGPYGNKAVRTPNIDRLAREGMRFNRAFVTCSSCSPSRASMITGRYPHNTDAEQLHWPLPANQITFVELLRKAGYWAGAAGKWHLGNQVKDRFDLVAEAGSRLGQPAKGKGPELADEKDESGCANWLPLLQKRPQNKPFFLWLAALDPHRPYRKGVLKEAHSPEKVVVPPYLPDTPEVRTDLALYYDEITRLDSYVGTMLDELDRQGVATNTLVILMSDNGRAFPRCKTTIYDSGIRTPFLVRWPAQVKPNSQSGSLVSSVDIAPTLIELAGAAKPPTFQGHSFVSVLKDPSASIRTEVFAERNWHDYDSLARAVRTERYKYIRNFDWPLPLTPPADVVRSATFQAMRRLRDAKELKPEQMVSLNRPKPEEELYDIEADPHEMFNLAGDSSRASILESLRKKVAQWQTDTSDLNPGLRAADEFDRETGEPLPGRDRPRRSKKDLLSTHKLAQ